MGVKRKKEHLAILHTENYALTIIKKEFTLSLTDSDIHREFIQEPNGLTKYSPYSYRYLTL